MGAFKKVRRELKRVFDNIRNEKLKNNLLQAIPFWIASLMVGLVAVAYAKLFVVAELTTAYIIHHFFWTLFLLTPCCFLLAGWLVKKYAPYARGSGIPQVMVSIELPPAHYDEKVSKLLSLRVIIVKIVSSLVFVVGGGVIGREGPTIQIAGSVFRKINEWLPHWWPKISRRNMIMTGAAAGLAAAFNTPLGGIVFAVEELTRTHISYFKTAIFSAVIIAGLTAQGLLGPYLYLGYPNVLNVSGYMFLGVSAVALFTGFVASAVSKLILLLMKWKASFNFQWKHHLYVIGCALVIVSLGYFVSEQMFGSGKQIMTSTLFTPAKYVPWYMPILRMAGPVLSFSTGGAGGIFAPALSAGASIGSFASGLLRLSDANTNLLILAGMVGFLTGITRTPFTSAIIVLEMTDRHNMIFYLMLAAMLASLAALVVDRRSFYDHLKHQYVRQLAEEDAAAGSIAPAITAV